LLRLVLYIALSLLPLAALAQKEQTYYGKRYLDIHIRSLDKYTQRIERQQKHLLTKLKRKEAKLAKQLQKTDSAAYAQYQQQTAALSYDSISKLQQNKETLAKAGSKANKAIDSLRKVQRFLQTSGGNTGAINTDLSGLQSQLNYQQYIGSLIDQRSQSLKSLGRQTAANIPALKGIEKEVFYGKSKMNEWKKVADEPSKAEEMALEYLQGTKDFSFAAAAKEGGMHSAAGEADLEKMGFQTKRQLGEQLQQQFGGNLAGLQEKMGSQVSDFQQQTQGIGKEIKQTQQQLKTAKADLTQTKQSITGLKNSNKPSFKVNPMRGFPFWKRIEKGYTFNTSRATPDGRTPALLELAGTVAFRHTPKLKYGVGLATTIGLGQDWSHIRFSWEGIGGRSFLSYELLYGISAYGGYERFFKQTANARQTDNNQQNYNQHNTANYSEAALLGLSKSYKINSRWNGAIQVLYDVWWRDKGLNSPVVVRIVNTK